MLLSPHATKSPNSIEKITSRIFVATFHGNPKPTLISCSSPTNIVYEQEVIDLYDDLSCLVRSVPKTQYSDRWWRPQYTTWQSIHHKFTYSKWYALHQHAISKKKKKAVDTHIS